MFPNRFSRQITALLAAFCCFMSATWAGPQPVFSETALHFGEVLQGQSRTKTLRVTNTGDAAYIIVKISSSSTFFATNTPFGIVEPGETLLLGVSFVPPSVLGNYSADLSVQATTGTTTIPMDGMVVLPTTLAYAPDTLRAETRSGHRDTAWLTLTNTGPSTLTYDLLGEATSGGSGGFFESFENPLVDKFTSLTGPYIAERITDASAPHGNRVLSLTGGNYDAGSGLWADVNDVTFTDMSYWFKPTSGGVGGVMRWWNANEIIVNIWHTAGPEQLTVNINGSSIFTIPCATGVWHRFEIKNMDHTARTCDIYLDGEKVVTGHTWNYNLTGVRRIQLSNWDYNTSFFDQVKLRTDNDTPLEVQFPEGKNGTLTAGESRQIPVEFNAEGVEPGDYEGAVTVLNNSQNLPTLEVPFLWKVTPGNRLLLRHDTLDLGQVYVGLKATRPLAWVNAGSESLLVFEATSSSPALTVEPAYGVVPGLDSLTVSLGLTAVATGPVLERIALKSTGGDAEMWVKAEAVHRPIASLMPDSICLTLVRGQDSTVLVQWNNQGLAPLHFELPKAGAAVNQTIRVLNTGTQTASRKTAAILRDSSVQVTEWYNPAVLPNFANYDLVLFPRDEQWDAWPFMNWMNPMAEYVKNGGNVLFSGRFNYDLPATLAVMKGNHPFYYHNSGDLQALVLGRPAEVFEGVPTPLAYQSEMFSMGYDPTVFQPWVASLSGGALLGYESLEQGKSGFIGYDFQQSDPNSRRLLLNMVRWMTDRYLPTWVSPASLTGSVSAGETQAWAITLRTDSLSTGTYQHDLFLATNDPATPFFTLPLKLMVIAPPEARFSANKSFTCNGKVSFQNQTLNEATTYHWDFGDGKISTEAAPAHQYTADGTYDVRLIACNALGCDTLLRKALIRVELGGTFCDTILMPTNQTRRIADECSGVIYDAGGPQGNYGNNQAGQVLIKTAPGTRIRLYLDGYDAACCFDYLQVFDGNDLNATPLVWAGTSVTSPQTVQSKSNELLVNFSTDAGNTAKGFSIRYECGDQLPPFAQFVYAPQSCSNFVAFQSTSLDAEQVYWDFGDGTTSSQPALTHIFAQTGTFNVTLYAIRGTDTASYTLPVKIEQVAFYADVNYPKLVKINTPVTFSVTSSQPIQSVSWDINGQFAGGLLPVVATFPQVGTFPVRAYIQANNGCFIQHEGQIAVGLTGTETPHGTDFWQLKMAPNPTSGWLQVELKGEVAAPARWLLSDQLGRTVLSGVWNAQSVITEQIDLGPLPTGVYWLSIEREGVTRRERVVKVW